ncbi:hypothetical protein ACFV23_38020, partial [Streptomyces sp. NPDC059627]
IPVPFPFYGRCATLGIRDAHADRRARAAPCATAGGERSPNPRPRDGGPRTAQYRHRPGRPAHAAVPGQRSYGGEFGTGAHDRHGGHRRHRQQRCVARRRSHAPRPTCLGIHGRERWP